MLFTNPSEITRILLEWVGWRESFSHRLMTDFSTFQQKLREFVKAKSGVMITPFEFWMDKKSLAELKSFQHMKLGGFLKWWVFPPNHPF